MKTLILILLFAAPAFSQDLDWKLIKEMSGEFNQYPGSTIKTSAAQIARGDNQVKLIIRFEFPDGAPWEMFRKSVPLGFDVSSISRMEFKFRLDCGTNTITTAGNSGDVYQFNGKRIKSKEPPFQIDSGNIFAQYFCEQGTAPIKAPTLKPK